MEKAVQAEKIYSYDEDEYIQKTFNDKVLTYRQVENDFEMRFNRRLAYDTLSNRNEYLIESTQATNNIAVSQRACATDPETVEIMLLNQEMIEDIPCKKQKTNDHYEKLCIQNDNLKTEINSLKNENKKIIANAAERLRVLNDRKSKFILSLKNDNIRLNAELNYVRTKLNETEKQLDQERFKQKNETNIESTVRLEKALDESVSQINENENNLKCLMDDLNKLKNENLILKIEKDKALSYAYHYVKKLKDFEDNLIKERLVQNQKKSKGIETSNSSQASPSSSSFSPSPSLSSGSYYLSINEFLGRPLMNITEVNNKNQQVTTSENKAIELNSEESKFLKNYMLKIENELKKYLENSIKSYYDNNQEN